MNPDDFNDPDVRALAILIPQEITAAEARGRKQAAEEIAERIEAQIKGAAGLSIYGEGCRHAADIARAYAAGQGTAP